MIVKIADNADASLRGVQREVNEDAHADDLHLVRQARGGDSRAFEQLVARYQQLVLKQAFSFFHDRDEALEVLQETFIRVYRHLEKFDESAGFKNWVYRIATNICIDLYRKNKRRADREQNMIVMDREPMAENRTPEECLGEDSRKRRLRQAVDRLPAREKMVFTLKHFSHLKFREIAEVMNISLGTVKSTHFRAINHVRDAVG